jgi:mannose-6-phosphate isomerase-like protein (cupin superfamily)
MEIGTRRRATPQGALAGKIRGVIQRAIGALDEVLDNLGVFRTLPDDLIATCPSGFRRVPISQGEGFYLSLQGFAPNQHAFAHTHPDSEEWVVVLKGSGQALFGDVPVELSPGALVGRGAKHPHGFISGPDPLQLLTVQIPRPAEGATTWDEPGTTTDPIDCQFGGKCRRCPRCGGHSTRMPGGGFGCENCTHRF